MNVTVLYGNERKGCTYHMAQQLIEWLGVPEDQITAFFLPRAMDRFCIGCCRCFAEGEAHCPHCQQVEPIRQAIDSADLVVFTSPVYVMRASGQMKTLLDHFAFLYMTHRPLVSMFSKTAVVLSTGAGGGTKAAMKDIAVSLRFWGVAKIYKYGAAVYASEWDGVSDKRKRKIAARLERLSGRLKKRVGHARPGVKTRVLFRVFRLFHRKFGYCPYDVAYWKDNGWLDKKRPWKT